MCVRVLLFDWWVVVRHMGMQLSAIACKNPIAFEGSFPLSLLIMASRTPPPFSRGVPHNPYCLSSFLPPSLWTRGLGRARVFVQPLPVRDSCKEMLQKA